MADASGVKYIVRFAQVHESFRLPELRALADLHGMNLDILHYSEYVCSIEYQISISSVFYSVYLLCHTPHKSHCFFTTPLSVPTQKLCLLLASRTTTQLMIPLSPHSAS